MAPQSYEAAIASLLVAHGKGKWIWTFSENSARHLGPACVDLDGSTGRLRLDVGERPRRHGHIGGPARPDEPQLRSRQAYPESRRGPVQEPASPVHLREQSAAARH